ncbi:CYFA0S32e01002g1_1 [Cyberlindnera fabianii]|uniref:beta-glucosidase n=1 Tax=Cyberlindnera fabianii TaxID=36022 RepID=A0A061BC23_CYBFA|nr:CYFA0S32e01002g1_1 [Cyberlindnera fabianii]
MSAQFDVEDVLSKLTLEEKIGLSAGIDFWHTYPVPRLNIPSLRLSDGPNGIRGTKFFNGVPGAVLPNGTGLASSFDKELLFEAGKLAGVEARHKSAHVDLGPTTNMQRGPNGGRGFESFSEDPYLAGIASAEVVKGLQSEHIAATMKHYVCNDLEHERNSSDSLITDRALREIYLEPFRLAVKFADPKAFMTGYNKINGEHVSQSKKFINDILRNEWEWDGTVMSDWLGTYTSKESIRAGLDLEMPGPPKMRTEEHVGQQIMSRELHINDLNDRVRGVLKLVKYCLDSGIPENGPEDTKNNTPETSATLRKFAAESIVLLKNEDQILPLKKEESVAVIGPNAKYAAYSGGGSATLAAYYTVTPYEGIKNKIGTDPKYTVGAYAHVSLPGLAEQSINPGTGKTGARATFYHEPRGTKNRRKFDQFDLTSSYHHMVDYKHEEVNADSTFYIDFECEFTPEDTAEYDFGLTVVGTAQLFVDDKLVVDNKTKQTRGNTFFNQGTIQEVGSIKLEKGKKYNIRIEFGSARTYSITDRDGVDFAGNGGICFGVARVLDADEEIARACEIAKSVDKVILCMGTNGEWESESYDRANISLPGRSDDLVSAVLKANPNAVVVNQSGTPCEFPWVKSAKAVVQAWFGGNELGNAIADVLYGDVYPSAKLSLTFPQKFHDNPAYLNFKTERGRVLYGEDIFVGYRYYEKLQKQVMFPFGYGLSYTTFAFSGLKVNVDEASNKLSVSIKVKNTGKVEGKEVVQVYIGKTESDVIRPVKELKGFEKVNLKAGEVKVVDIELSLKDAVSYFDEWENKWHVQDGEYSVYVGSSSDDIEAIEKFDIKKAFYWTGL